MNQPLYLFKLKKDLRLFLTKLKSEKKTIGFVPTMGALHRGHTSLIQRAKSENDVVLTSIFVNRTQFNDARDFEKYPRTVEKDIEILTAFHCDILFLPDEKEIYYEASLSLRKFDLGGLDNFLEGASRPGHFQGVANVVYRLLEIAEPDKLYLGQKDFQQVMVIEKMMQQSNLQSQIVMCPIIREDSGLALSSRNVRLTDEQRRNASVIFRELLFIKDNFYKYSFDELRKIAVSEIHSVPETRVDYLEFFDAGDLHIVKNRDDAEHIICLTAVYVGEVRLLDNILLK